MAVSVGLVMKPEMGFAWFQVELRKLCTVITLIVCWCDHQACSARCRPWHVSVARETVGGRQNSTHDFCNSSTSSPCAFLNWERWVHPSHFVFQSHLTFEVTSKRSPATLYSLFCFKGLTNLKLVTEEKVKVMKRKSCLR